MALEKQPQCEVLCKWTVYKFSNLLIKNTCNVDVIRNNGKAHLFLQELLKWHLELHFNFSNDICTFYWCSTSYNGSLQIPAYFQTLSLRLTEETVNLRAHHVPWWSCCQQLWIHCEHTATQVGLPGCPTDKAQKSWHQQRLLGHFWGLDILDQGQAPWPQRLSQYQLLEVLSWRETIFWACCSWPDFAPSCSMLIYFFLTQKLQVTFSPKPSLSSL